MEQRTVTKGQGRCIGVDAAVVVFQAEEELLEHWVLVGGDAIVAGGLHRPHAEPWKGELWQQGTGDGLVAFDLLFVGLAVRVGDEEREGARVLLELSQVGR